MVNYLKKVNRMRIIILALSLLLCGCVSSTDVLVNSEGEQVECSAMGYGWVGAPAALIMKNKCMNDYKEMGYSTGGTTSASTTASQSLEPFLLEGYANPLTVSSNDYHYLVDTKNSNTTAFPKTIILAIVYPNAKLFNRPDKSQFYATHQISHYIVQSDTEMTYTQDEYIGKDKAVVYTHSANQRLSLPKGSVVATQILYLEK
jgi:hypothetical protein